MYNLRIVLVGDSEVGKTSVINFLRKNYNEHNESTVFNTYSHFLFDEEKNRNYNLEIIDTSGLKDYVKVRQPVYQKTNLIILCFAINNLKSFTNINDFWIPELNEFIPDTKRILLGLKNDTRYNQTIYDEKNIISHCYATKFSNTLNIPYFEFGKIDKNSENVMDTLINLSAEISGIILKGIDTIDFDELKKNNKKKTNNNKNNKTRKCLIQ